MNQLCISKATVKFDMADKNGEPAVSDLREATSFLRLAKIKP